MDFLEHKTGRDVSEKFVASFFMYCHKKRKSSWVLLDIWLAAYHSITFLLLPTWYNPEGFVVTDGRIVFVQFYLVIKKRTVCGARSLHQHCQIPDKYFCYISWDIQKFSRYFIIFISVTISRETPNFRTILLVKHCSYINMGKLLASLRVFQV